MTAKNVHPIWSDAELDAALADLHSDPGPADGLAFARASLVAAAGTPLDTAPFTQAPPARRKSRGSWRWISVAAAVAALTGGLVVATQGSDPAPSAVTPAAATPGLDQLKGVDLPITPGMFRHTAVSAWSVIDRGSNSEPTGFVGTQTDLWVAADPAAEWRRHSWMTNSPAGLTVPTPHHEPVPVHTTDESGPGGMFPAVEAQYKGQDFKGSWDTPTARFLTALPADVQALRDRLINDQSSMSTELNPGKPNNPAMSIQMVRRVLELGVLRGEVRVALWKALAQVPGIVTTPGKAGPDGRAGIGFTAKGAGDTLIADPATAQLIAYTLPPKSSGGSKPARNELETIYTYSVTKTDH